jgi:hypothetical protein
VIVQGTSVGLDVHALSVVAHAVDEETGKIARARLCPDHREILGWLHQLRAPVRVAYEAGPTGFGLARAVPRPLRRESALTPQIVRVLPPSMRYSAPVR